MTDNFFEAGWDIGCARYLATCGKDSKVSLVEEEWQLYVRGAVAEVDEHAAADWKLGFMSGFNSRGTNHVSVDRDPSPPPSRSTSSLPGVQSLSTPSMEDHSGSEMQVSECSATAAFKTEDGENDELEHESTDPSHAELALSLLGLVVIEWEGRYMARERYDSDRTNVNPVVKYATVAVCDRDYVGGGNHAKIKCPVCSETFVTMRTVERHIDGYRFEKYPKKAQFPLAHFEYANSGWYAKHRLSKRQRDPGSCTLCGKKVSGGREDALRVHAQSCSKARKATECSDK
ncbi:unnamed protein product [Peniophora sp. CBMAI 1063]|nr:unnamed protein product [Peniophora sp. CBMAI 1063]